MNRKAIVSLAMAAALAAEAPVVGSAAGIAPKQELTLQQAAKKVKSGLKYEKGKYYYYVKGKKLKKRWKVLKRTGKYYRFYFGADGAAYTGKKSRAEITYKVARIGGDYYGFDPIGRMLKGTYVTMGKFYVFSSTTGKLNRQITTKLRSACAYGKDTGTLLKLLANIGQKPLKRETMDGCFGDGKDVIYTFRTFQISGYQNQDGSEIFFSVMSR